MREPKSLVLPLHYRVPADSRDQSHWAVIDCQALVLF